MGQKMQHEVKGHIRQQEDLLYYSEELTKLMKNVTLTSHISEALEAENCKYDCKNNINKTKKQTKKNLTTWEVTHL